MKVCSHCGTPLQGDERFCVACGADVSSMTAPASVAASGPVTPVAPTPAPPASAAPIAHTTVPVAYAAPVPAPIPVFVSTPAPPAKTSSKVWTWIIIAAVLLGGYYYSKTTTSTTPTPAAPAQPGAPAEPGAPAQPGTPAQPGVPTQPGAPAQPGVQGQPVSPVQQQSFSGNWRAIYGYVGVTNARWTNRSSIAIQSATLQCDQYAANGADLTQTQMTLNGPVQPGGTTTFNPFQMGAVNVYMTRVNCAIVAVTPSS